MNNQNFVTQASSSNNFEIVAGSLAITKGTSSDVRSYGQHMVTEHTAVGTEMIYLAQSKGWTIPTALQVKEQTNLNTLNNAGTATFDKEFARIMVESHQDAIDLFTTASSKAGVPDADLRNFAATKLPALKAHLADAVNLQTAVNK